MANLNAKFKKILEDLEKNIKSEEDLEFVRIQIFNLYNIFYDEMTEREEESVKKMTALAGTQAVMQEKLEKLEQTIKDMEKELYIDEDSEYTITCPYCNTEVSVECEDLENDEIECPQCNNFIELDWGDECDCGGEHDGCNHDCSHCDDKD